MIKPSDLTPIDEDLARRIIVYARSIAPCLDSLVDGAGEDDPKPKADAIAILKGVAAEVPRSGSRRVKSERVGPAGAEYFDVSSAFSGDDRAALRGLCGASTANVPIGSFPKAGVVTGLWPEDC